MRFKYTGNKKDVGIVTIKNGDTLTIKSGSPVFIKANGTDDGLAVVSANNLGAANENGFFGMATADILTGAFGEAQAFGFFDTARVRTATRAASTDVWASYSAGALFDILGMCTGTGAVAASVSADQAVSRVAAGSAISVAAHQRLIYLGQTFVSATTQASSLSGGLNSDASATCSVSLMKVFVRVM